MSEDAESIDPVLKRWTEKFQEEKRKFDALSPEEKQAIEDRKKRQEEEAHAFKVQQFRFDWNAPRRQLSKTDLDRTGAWGKKEEELTKMLGKGFLVALVGGRGPGKTQMAVELMKKCTFQLRSAYYNTLTGLFLKIKATFKNDSQHTEDDLVRSMISPSLLVLDEISRRSDSDWENRILYEIIDRRYCEMKDTLLIANQSKAQFIEAIGESIASRMQETGGIMECTWESYRL